MSRFIKSLMGVKVQWEGVGWGEERKKSDRPGQTEMRKKRRNTLRCEQRFPPSVKSGDNLKISLQRIYIIFYNQKRICVK